MSDEDDLVVTPPADAGEGQEAPQETPDRPEGMPEDHHPPLLWALWYREQGLWPLPIRDAEDVADWIEYLTGKGVESGLSEEDARAAAVEKARRGSKHTFVKWRKFRTGPTSEQCRRWWANRPERGIALLCGPGRGIAVIDVDTAKGGDADPWAEGCATVAVTPSGGVHLVYREAEIRSTTSEIALAVDTRGIGGLIAAPAGSASPGRRWLRWRGLGPFPSDVAARLVSGVPRAIAGVSVGQTRGAEDDDLEGLVVAPSREDRSFASALREPAHDGEKHRKASAIVGLLARPRPVPRDGVEAALDLLTSWAEARGLAVDVYKILERVWRSALESDSRPAEFALEVLKTWNEIRCSPAWPPSKVVDTANGLWRTATAREGERAAAATAETSEDEAELERFMPSRAATYGIRDLARDRRRGLLPIDSLPHYANHTGEIDTTVPTGHGLGEILNAGLGGGLAPGYLLVLGADQAKGGKTALVEQLVFGIALRTLAVLAGLASGPVVSPYYLGEMYQGAEDGPPPPARQLAHRDLARWLGVDGNLFRRGDETGGDAPGIRRLAAQLNRDPGELATEILETASRTLEGGQFRRAQDLMRLINPRILRSGNDRAADDKGPPIDHRRGVPLLRAVKEAIKADRARKAKAWKRAESEIWPLLFIDPIQRYQGGGDNAVGSLDEFVEELRAICDELQAIVIATSDTNKESAKGGVPKDASPFARAAFVFRGSYKLLHLPDAALVLTVDWPKEKDVTPTSRVWVALNRWGAPLLEPAYFSFVAEAGRYIPLDGPPVSTSDLDLDPDDEPEEKPQPRKGGKFTKKDQ